MSSSPIQQTRHWIDTLVVGLNLCPFAASTLNAETVEFSVCNEVEYQALLKAVLDQLERLNTTDVEKLSTSFLIFTQSLNGFEDYLALVEDCNQILIDLNLDEDVQIATFHPDYCFQGVSESDAANYSNRSPFPMLHFLREAHITRVLEHYPNPEQIPDNNISLLRELGEKGIVKLLNE